MEGRVSASGNYYCELSRVYRSRWLGACILHAVIQLL